jgi:galactokinase
VKLFVPGRICLFGEHSDWAGGYRRINADIEKGYTLICGTDQGIFAEVEAHPTSLVLTSSTPGGGQQGPYEIPMQAKLARRRPNGAASGAHIAGVAYQVLTTTTCGLVINNYKTDLPVKKGLSSSAAICVLAARAFNRVYDLKLTIRGEMELAYQGEITTPSRCGRMDQGCAFGNRPVVMTFDGDRLDTTELQVKENLYFVIVDLGAQKDTMEILNRLNRCYPFAENEIERESRNCLARSISAPFLNPWRRCGIGRRSNGRADD